jgi:hypothetical protein
LQAASKEKKHRGNRTIENKFFERKEQNKGKKPQVVAKDAGAIV